MFSKYYKRKNKSSDWAGSRGQNCADLAGQAKTEPITGQTITLQPPARQLPRPMPAQPAQTPQQSLQPAVRTGTAQAATGVVQQASGINKH